MRRISWLPAVILAYVIAATPALTSPLYTVSFGYYSSVSSATPFRRDSIIVLPPSNGTGLFTGGAYAGEGYVNALQRIDCEWVNGSSGGFGSRIEASAQTTDFLITGPIPPYPGTVAGTLHLRVAADLLFAGGFPANGGHHSNISVRADVFGYGNIYGTVIGAFQFGNAGPESYGCLTGQTDPHVDFPFTLTSNFPVGGPVTLLLTLVEVGSSYGNAFWSPGLVATDAGGAPGDHTGRGLRIDGSSGVVMTLPAGYTLNSPAWGIVNNTYPNLVGVDEQTPGEDMRLELASANPSSGEARVTLALPRDGLVRVVLYDLAGRVQRTLFDGWRAAGTHTIAWEGRTEAGAAAPAGLYFIRAESEGQSVTRRLVRAR